jgi:hypothetical protein
MDDLTVSKYVSARRKKRLTDRHPAAFHRPNPHADVQLLCQCFAEICRTMPQPMQLRASQILAEELSELLDQFCFDLSLIKHDGEPERVFRKSGVRAAVDVALAPFDEIDDLIKRFRVGQV